MGLFQLHVAFEKGKCMQSTFKIVLFESPCALSLTSLLSSCSPSCNQLKKKKKEKNSHCLLGQTLGRRSLNSDKCNIKTKKKNKKQTTRTIYTLKCLFGYLGLLQNGFVGRIAFLSYVGRDVHLVTPA